MEKKYFANFNDLESIDIKEPAMNRKIFFGDKMLIGKNVIKAHTLVPAHSHPHEQLTYVESGECDVCIDGEIKQHVTAGGIAWFPANCSHEILCTGDEDVVAYDIFAPVREDWIEMFDKK